MSDSKVLDWKGNEVKKGMIIYFVETKRMAFGKFGMMMPDGKGGHSEHWESDEDYEKRKEKEKEPIWYLGQPYTIEENNGELYYRTMPDDEGYTFGFQLRYKKDSTIAIKGISDANPLSL